MTTYREQIILTPSPASADSTALRLSVHVGIRLQSDSSTRTTLNNFPDLLNFRKFLYGNSAWEFRVVFASGEIYQTTGFPSQPQKLSGTVSVQPGSPTTPLFVDPNTATPVTTAQVIATDFWGALFNSQTPVDPVTIVAGPSGWIPTGLPLSATKLRSYPMDDVADFAIQQWLAVATSSPDDHPNVSTLLASSPGLAQLAGTVGRTDRRQRGRTDGDPTGQGMSPRELQSEQKLNQKRYYDRNDPSWGASDPMVRLREAFAQFSNIHRNKASEGPGLLPGRVGPDFHKVIAGLSGHPAMLRALGLVFDLVITPKSTGWPSSSLPFGQQMVQVIAAPTGASAMLNIHSAAAHVNVGTAGSGQFTAFYLQDGREEIANRGMLKLANTNSFRVFTHDIDGAGTKVLHLANELAVKSANALKDVSKFGSPTPLTPPPAGEVAISSATADVRTPTTTTLPTLRNSGFVVTQTQRSVQVANRLTKQFATGSTGFEGIVAANPNNNAGLSIANGAAPGTYLEIYGEDVVAGYRFDVFDSVRNRWFSLMKRDQMVHFSRSGYALDLKVVEEEASIGLAMTRPVGTSENFGYRELRESLVRWSGWSLAGTRPGAALPQANTRDQEVLLTGQFPRTITLSQVVPQVINNVTTYPVAVYPVQIKTEIDGSKSKLLGAAITASPPGAMSPFWTQTTANGITSIVFDKTFPQHPGLAGLASVILRFESSDVSDPSASYQYSLDEAVPTPGTLPVLRYGRQYKLRARPMDIAGNGVPFATGDVGLPLISSSPAVRYQRLEPIAPPKVFLPAGSPGETLMVQGENLDTLVYRSIVSSPETVLAPANLYPAIHADGSTQYPDAKRVLVAPLTSEEEAELAGWADTSAGRPDASLYNLLSALTPSKPKAGKESVFDPASTMTFLPDPAATGVAIYGIPGVTGSSVVETGGSGTPTVQVVNGIVLIDYRRKGIAFADDPTSSRLQADPIVLSLAPPSSGNFSWDVINPSYQPFHWDRSSGVLTINLPPGRMADLQISSYVSGSNSAGVSFPSMFALPSWVDAPPTIGSTPSWVAQAPAMTGASLRGRMNVGRFWMVTPWRTVRLVHATSSPMVKPAFDGSVPMSFKRRAASTTSTVLGGIKLHHPSTGKIELFAEWTDFSDLGPGMPLSYNRGPGTPFGQFTPSSGQTPPSTSDPSGPPQWGAALSASSHVGEIKIEDPLNAGIQTFSIPDGALTQRFGDTKHRKVAFSAAAITNFAVNFTESISLTPQANQRYQMAHDGASVVGVVASSVSVIDAKGLPIEATIMSDAGAKVPNWTLLDGTAPGAAPVGSAPEAVARAIQFSTSLTTQLGVGLTAPLTVRFLPAPGVVVTDPASKATAHATNTRRPSPPKIAYGIPTFNWTRSTSRFLTSTTVTSARATNGFRIFLHRPWFTSGADELLGVVVDPKFYPPPKDDPLAPTLPPEQNFITTWGLDPIAATNGSLSGTLPKATDFTNVATLDNSLPASTRTSLAELPDAGSFLFSGGKPLFVPASVGVVGFRPNYDPDRDLWYADIDMVAPAAYQPMVRLALVRYQPYADPSLSVDISRVVRADFLQLPANRTLMVSYDWGSLVIGHPSGTQSYGIQLSGPGTPNTTQGLLGLTQTSVPDAVAFIEWQPKSMAGQMAGWTPATSSKVQLHPTTGPLADDSVVWTGSIDAPTLNPAYNYRIVVEQFELYNTGRTSQIQTSQGNLLNYETAKRLIYTDIFPLA
ncbi:MAG: hypothetical protein WCK41_12570 [Actinomycetes bacterium]